MSTLAAPLVAPVSAPPDLRAALPPLPPPAPPRPRARGPVTLADRVARAFPPLACVRGFRYFASGRVEVVNLSDAAVDAAVKGKRCQQVRLRIEEGRLAAGCTCCAKLMGPAACKHVWATLLEIDRRGAFESLRTTARVLSLGVLDAAKTKPTPKPPAPVETATTPKPRTTTKPAAKARPPKAPEKPTAEVHAKPKVSGAKRARARARGAA